MTLAFQEDNHEYKLDGNIIPSVTQIIQGAGLINLDFIPKDLLEEKADLGKKVHKATELYDVDNLQIDDLHETLRNYLDQWIKFRRDYNFTPELIEVEYFHPLYRFAGRIDRVGEIGNKLSIIDIKTGTKQKTHAIQTAGYKILYNYDRKKTEQAKQRMIIYLSSDKYEVEINEVPTDENVFLAALTIYNYKRSTL